MINHDKWINSLHGINTRFNKATNQLDHDRWINTIPIDHDKHINNIPKKDTYNSVKKYSLVTILFVCGLLFVSVVKNETRSLQKIINNLEASIDVIKFNLDQAILDNEAIISPENISLLAEKYLNIDLVSYNKSQIRQLSDENEKFTKVDKIKKENINKKKTKNLTASIKTQVAKKIEAKKTEMRKLQELYYNPKSIPKEIKTQVVVQIEEKKIELRNIYNAPKDILTLERVGKWSVVQIVKLFLGMPVIPGR